MCLLETVSNYSPSVPRSLSPPQFIMNGDCINTTDMISLGLILAPFLAYVLYGLYWLSGGELGKDNGKDEDKNSVNTSNKATRSISVSGGVTPQAIVVNAVAAAILHIQSNLISSHLTSPHLTSPHLTSPQNELVDISHI